MSGLPQFIGYVFKLRAAFPHAAAPNAPSTCLSASNLLSRVPEAYYANENRNSAALFSRVATAVPVHGLRGELRRG